MHQGRSLRQRALQALPLFAVLLVAGCTDIVKSRYETLADARADELFGRGWLPDVLPPSAVDIVTINNLDINESHGEFSFDPDDASTLLRQLQRGVPGKLRPHVSDEVRSAQARKGSSVWWLERHDNTWVFMCTAANGHCEYSMWSDWTPPASEEPTTPPSPGSP